MDKVKQDTFSNFDYEIIKSIDERCVDVKCTYKYGDKNLTHYFSYVKSGNKQPSYYISKAKADMAKLVKSKNPATVAKKDLNGSKATFFKRHKKPILIATAAVLVAGVAVATTLVTINLLNRNSELVTEADIDKHLVFPKTELKTIYDESAIGAILEKAIAKVEVDESDPTNGDTNYYYDLSSNSNIRNLTDLTIKRMGPFGMKVPDPFDYADVANNFVNKKDEEKDAMLSGIGNYGGYTPSPQGLVQGSFNDTTEFYTNNSFKTKSLNSVYAKVDVKKNPVYTTSHIVNTYDEIVEGLPVKSVYLSDNIITQKKDKNNNSKVFEAGKTTVDGVQTQDLSSVLYKGAGDSDCEDYINEEISSQVVYYADLNQLIQGADYYATPTFYQSGEKDVYAIYFEPYVTSVNIPSVYFPPIYDDPTQPPIVEGGIKGYVSPRHIWHFVNDDNLGWILKSYAMDDSTYTDYNDRYERLPHAVSVNKVKGYVEFNYGDRTSAKKDADSLTVPELDPSEVKAPSLPVNRMSFGCYDSYADDLQNEDKNVGYVFSWSELIDLTISNRMSSEDDSYVAAGLINIPTQRDLDEWCKETTYDAKNLHLQMSVGSVYFEENEETESGERQKPFRSLTRQVQDYNGCKTNDYFEIEKTDTDGGSPFIKLKADDKGAYKALGHTFNVIVTYKNEPLQMYTPEGRPAGKTLNNWILAPQSITFILVN